MLSRVLGLNDAERAVLLHAALCKYQRDLRPVLVDCKAGSAQDAYGMLASVLGCDAGEVAAALRVGSRLESLGLIDTPIAEHAITDLGDLMRVSDKLLAVLTADYATEADMMAAFTRPAGRHAARRSTTSRTSKRMPATCGAAAGGGRRRGRRQHPALRPAGNRQDRVRQADGAALGLRALRGRLPRSRRQQSFRQGALPLAAGVAGVSARPRGHGHPLR